LSQAIERVHELTGSQTSAEARWLAASAPQVWASALNEVVADRQRMSATASSNRSKGTQDNGHDHDK
jgi:hypothetical protein